MSIYAYTLPHTNRQKTLNYHKNEVLKCSSLKLLCSCCCCFHRICSCCRRHHRFVCMCCVCVCTNFFRCHLKILDARRVTWSVYHTENAPTLGANCQTFCHLEPRICASFVCARAYTVREVCTHTWINLRTDFKSVTSHQIVEWKVNMNDRMDIIPSTLCIN